MINTEHHLRRRILPPIIAILLLVTLAGILSMVWLEQHHILTQLEKERRTVNSFYGIVIEQDARLFQGILEMIAVNPLIQTAWLEKDRQKLRASAQQIFKSLSKNYRITHFYFYNPNRTVFLRMHKPDIHGDRIDRDTLIQSVKSGKPAHGLELGLFGKFVLRVVYPWYINNSLAGYIELGEDINHLLPLLSQVSGVQVFEIIDKQLMREDEWNGYNRLQSKPGNWNLFPNVVLTQQTMTDIPPQVQRYFGRLQHHNIGKDTDNILNVDYRQHSYRTYAMPLKNSNSEIVGEMLVLFDTTHYFARLKLMIGILIGIAILITLFAILFFHRYFGRVEADIDATNLTLKRAIKKHQQTENALMMSNKELEYYSYSIAHDLRAPLRSIISFSQILDTDAHDKLTAEEKSHLQRIIRAGKYMANVIDDILNLSRITRSEICIENINLSKLAQQAVYNLRQLQINREVDLHIEDNITAKGDPILLGVVLQNLLQNSLKYTRRKPIAQIQFGNKMLNGEQVFFVADNGAGFEMQYSSMLFKPFHRLHTQGEFTGTGIGLATVARIVERHGGKIWADGIRNEGATFYFTLPQ